MKIDDKIRDEKITILTEKLQKYLRYHLEKLINVNNLKVKCYHLLIADK